MYLNDAEETLNGDNDDADEYFDIRYLTDDENEELEPPHPGPYSINGYMYVDMWLPMFCVFCSIPISRVNESLPSIC